MSKMLLPRLKNGELLLPGRFSKEITWPFVYDTSLPTTLNNISAGSSTLGFQTIDAGGGYVVLNAVGGSKAGIEMTNGLWLQSSEAVLFSVDGIYVTGSVTNFDHVQIGIMSTSQGAYFDLKAAPSKAYYWNGSTFISSDINYDLTYGDSVNHRDLSVLLLHRYKQLYLLEGDQVIANVDISSMPNASNKVYPTIAVYPTASNNVSLRVQQLRLKAWYY